MADKLNFIKIEGIKMIIRQWQKPTIPKYASYDYIQVYDGNDRFVGWIKVYYKAFM